MKSRILIALCLLAGCSSMPETKYYILSSDAANAQMVESRGGETVLAIRRIRLADYLRQSGLVTQTDDFQIRPAYYHRWGEPLHKGIRRNLALQLSRTMNGYRIEAEPGNHRRIAYRLDLEVEHFHANTSGIAILSGRWTLYRTEDDSILRSQQFHLSDQMEESGYRGAVHSQIALLERLSVQISAAAHGAIAEFAQDAIE